MAKVKRKPLTREDVLRLIKENGDTADGLDLSRRTFEENIDLSSLNLSGIILKDAWFISPHLESANLFVADLRGAKLLDAHLEEAVLIRADLERADLYGAHLQGASLHGARYLNARLEHADWGNQIIGEEKRDKFGSAGNTYRQLKVLYTQYGLYKTAGEFFFREMTVKRKALQWWPSPFPRVWSKFISLICGYGERPLRVIGWAASVVLGLALIYFVIGSAWEWAAFGNSLYFSAVSFTALGYGSWLKMTNDWIRGIGAFESFIGVFTMALFLITFVRKMTR